MLPVKRKRRMGREFHSEKNDTMCTLSVVTYSVQHRLPKKLQAPPGAFVRDRCLKSTISFPLCVSAFYEAWSIPHPEACRPEISLWQDHADQVRMKSGKKYYFFSVLRNGDHGADSDGHLAENGYSRGKPWGRWLQKAEKYIMMCTLSVTTFNV